MPSNPRFVAPRKRPVISDVGSLAKTAGALLLFGLVFGAWFTLMEWLMSFPVLIQVAILVGITLAAGAAILALVVVAQGFLPSRSEYPAEFGTLEVDGSLVVQTPASEVPCQIDAALPYEYSVLDRYDVSSAVFRLYQHDTALTFRFSDPGAARVVRDVMGLKWPPRARHAGRSYAPPAV